MGGSGGRAGLAEMGGLRSAGRGGSLAGGGSAGGATLAVWGATVVSGVGAPLVTVSALDRPGVAESDALSADVLLPID